MDSELKASTAKFNNHNSPKISQSLELKNIKPIDIQQKDLIANYKKKKSEDDSNSINLSEYSTYGLTSIKPEMIGVRNGLRTTKINDSFIHKKYQMILRMEALKYFTERERQQKIFEERNSYIHLFDNNLQFLGMLKKTEKQLYFYILHIIFLILYESIIALGVGKGDIGLSMASFILSITSFIFYLIVFLALKSGFLKDPNLSQSFRFLVILGFATYIISYGFNIVSFFASTQKLKDNFCLIFRIFTYLIFLITIVLIEPALQRGYFLFLESVLIFFRKKTEYSILILNEQNNMSLNQNNTTSNLVTNNELNLDKDNNNNINLFKNDQQDFNNYNYYSKFHVSVTYRDKNNGTF